MRHSALTCQREDCSACAWLDAQISAMNPEPRTMTWENYPNGQPLPYDGFEPPEP